MDLETAQRDIAADWIAAYKKYFKTDAPLETQTGLFMDDDLDSREPARALNAVPM